MAQYWVNQGASWLHIVDLDAALGGPSTNQAIIGQIAAEAGTVPIGPAIWAGNILVFFIGAFLTAKVLRG